MKKEVTSQHIYAHFGTVYDALGYQQPPHAVGGRLQGPAHTATLKGVIEDLRAHLAADVNITDDTYNIVENALMAATSANMVCYYCQQPGHIASTCPLKQQHRLQQGGTRQGWQTSRPGPSDHHQLTAGRQWQTGT